MRPDDIRARWEATEEEQARLSVWLMMYPRWHFTSPRFSSDGNWQARCGSFTASAATLGRLMDQLVAQGFDPEVESLDKLPDEPSPGFPVSPPHPFMSARVGAQWQPRHGGHDAPVPHA